MKVIPLNKSITEYPLGTKFFTASEEVFQANYKPFTEDGLIKMTLNCLSDNTLIDIMLSEQGYQVLPDLISNTGKGTTTLDVDLLGYAIIGVVVDDLPETPTSTSGSDDVPSHYRLGETGLDANDIAAIIMNDMPDNVSHLEASYWHQALCYVLRMYRKESVVNDANKAITYLQKIIEINQKK